MSSSNPFNYFRSWMDQPMRDPVTELLTPEYAQGLKQFMAFAANQPSYSCISSLDALIWGRVYAGVQSLVYAWRE
ncbi:predicted protein [Arabidopsis lyrata subsp. lyrata]|uniref:Predicted protein n=1 Tax=Arabidopsis lyrata subsp. lyrata TaxID=81972 RepID=D7LSG3_ARALL|nr:predicted protein [Arabidopsis lyrata subsp. lyrata]